jgi:hypothetical protein
MANVSKIKRTSTLGEPPPLTEASPNLEAPETAPAPSVPAAANKLVAKAPAKIDGRSLRRTNRIMPFATRVSPEFDARVRAIAEKERILIVEVLERALDAYEAAR